MVLDATTREEIRKKLSAQRKSPTTSNDRLQENILRIGAKYGIVPQAQTPSLRPSLADELPYTMGGALRPAQAEAPKSAVVGIAKAAPEAIGTAWDDWVESERKRKQEQTLGEQAYTELVKRPATIIGKGAGMIAGGLSEIGKSFIELGGTYARAAVTDETVGEANLKMQQYLYGNENRRELEKKMFGFEVGSYADWQPGIEKYLEEANALPIEKKTLPLLLPLLALSSDLAPGGKPATIAVRKTLEKMAQETGEVAIRRMLRDLAIPDEVAIPMVKRIVDADNVNAVKKIIREGIDPTTKQITKELLTELGDVDLSKVARTADDVAAPIARTVDDVAAPTARTADDIAIPTAARMAEDVTVPAVHTTDDIAAPLVRATDELAEAAAEMKRAGKTFEEFVSETKATGVYKDTPETKRLFTEVEKDVKDIINLPRVFEDILKDSKQGDDILGKLQQQVDTFNKKYDTDYQATDLLRGGVVERDILNTATQNAYAKSDIGWDYAPLKARVWDNAPTTATPAPRQAPQQGTRSVRTRQTATQPQTPRTESASKTVTKDSSPAQKKAAERSINSDKALKSMPPRTDKAPTQEAVRAYKDARSKVERGRDLFLEHIQDEMIRVRRIIENPNVKVSDASNPYDAEIRFHGRIGHRLETLKESVKEIDKDILQTAKRADVESAQFSKEVNDYLIASHAPERNSALYDGAAGITTKDAVARKIELEKKPYANELKRIASRIQQISNKTLDTLLEGEVITKDLYDMLRAKYKHHIPLYRVMGEQDDFIGALAKGFDVKQSGIKTAKGSSREVADVLGNVVFNYEQALIRAEKNRVDLATLRLVRENAETFGDMFKVRKPRAIGESFDGKPILEKTSDPQTLVMFEKGKPIFIEIKDPNLAVALRGIGRHKFTGMMRGIATISRFYSGIHTRFNPEFAFSNKIRDLQEVLVYTTAQKEMGVRQSAKTLAREARLENIRAVTDLLRGKDSEGARMYKQMLEDGGTTGGMGLSTRKQVEVDIESIRKLNRSNPRKAAQKTLELIDNWNTIFEDSSRLSVYRTAIENGVSRERAAVLAKESSVNFNKFGKQGQLINGAYIFANASIQGSVKTLRAMKNPKVAAVVTTAIVGSVYTVNEWNDSVDPDWRNKITTWDRLNGLSIMIPNEDGENTTYFTIPVGWGIKPIKVMAENMYDLAVGKGEGLVAASEAVLVSVLEAYNPVGGTDWHSAVTPTIFDMESDIARNQAWHGGKIRPDWDKNAPASIQYFPSLRDTTTGRTAIAISKGLSGIGYEVSPENIEYGFTQLVGGAGRTASKFLNTITAIGAGEELVPAEIPVMSRFYKSRPPEEVGAGAREFEKLSNALQEQSRERFYLSQNAEDSLQQLENVPREQAAKMFEDIRSNDPALAKEIAKLKKEKDKGLTFIDRKILQLGVTNGERARFLVGKFEELETDEERRQLWNEYREKGIISDEVARQVKLELNAR